MVLQTISTGMQDNQSIVRRGDGHLMMSSESVVYRVAGFPPVLDTILLASCSISGKAVIILLARMSRNWANASLLPFSFWLFFCTSSANSRV